DSATVYVANNGSADIAVIDAATNTVTATVPVGPNPLGMAVTPDGALLYVATAGDNSVVVLDTATMAAVGTVAVGADPGMVAISPDGVTAYGVNSGDDTISVVRMIAPTPPAPQPTLAATGSEASLTAVAGVALL